MAQVESDNKSEKASAEAISCKEKTTQNKKKQDSCNYHLGYLSERVKKEKIPDECLSCKDILECMLKKMRQET
jgi:hypothetical protein